MLRDDKQASTLAETNLIKLIAKRPIYVYTHRLLRPTDRVVQ